MFSKIIVLLTKFENCQSSMNQTLKKMQILFINTKIISVNLLKIK